MMNDLAGYAPNDNGEYSYAALPHGFIGFSPVMQHLYSRIENAAKSEATVFITGESGSGKELCAESLHRLSRRAAKPFVPINCAAIPRDLLESELFGHVKGAFTGAVADRDGAVTLAAGGTLFLDEIAEMAPDMQTKLLRFLQDFKFRRIGGGKLETADVRIICATNRDPLAEIRAGRLRADLYYRLHVLPLHMPPLRERGNDILDIAAFLLHRYAQEEGKSFSGFSEEAESLLMGYSWPGNIRELQNVLRHVVVMNDGRIVTADMLPAEIITAQKHTTADGASEMFLPSDFRSSATFPTLAEIENRAIEAALERCGGNVPRAAALLGIAPSTLYRKRLVQENSPLTGGLSRKG